MRVGKFVVLNIAFRAGLAETFHGGGERGSGMVGGGGNPSCRRSLWGDFAHKVLPESVFADNSFSLILVLVGFSLKYQPPWRLCMVVSKLDIKSLCVSLLALNKGRSLPQSESPATAVDSNTDFEAGWLLTHIFKWIWGYLEQEISLQQAC